MPRPGLKKRGLIYRRRLWLCEPSVAHYIRTELQFPDVQQAAVLEKTASDGTTECWYLLTSLPLKEFPPQEFLAVVRKHWQIENGLHHVKDRTLKEDMYQGKQAGLIETLTILRNGVVTLLNQLTPPKNRKESRPAQMIAFSHKPKQLLQRLTMI
jgi:predicted transposase YbfD/YdcC